MKKNGFSLVELMMAVGISAGLAFYFFQVFQKQQVEVKLMNQNFEMLDFYNEIRRELSVESKCFKAFGKKAVPSQEVINELLRFKVGETKGLYNLLVTNIQLVVSDKQLISKGAGNLTLSMSFKKTDGHLKEVRVPLNVVLDSQGTIAACSARALSSSKTPSSLKFLEVVHTNNADLNNKTGKEVCEERGKRCAWMERCQGMDNSNIYNLTEINKCPDLVKNQGHAVLDCDNTFKYVATAAEESKGCWNHLAAVCIN